MNKSWSPITEVQLKEIINYQLKECTDKQKEIYNKYCIDLERAPIERYGKIEYVFIVAKRGEEVMYYEDVEEGFNFSRMSPSGKILEHGCNQDELKYSLSYWIDKNSEESM